MQIKLGKDHCPLTGKFRGLAHNNCNLKTQKRCAPFQRKLFHVFYGYDCHLIFENLFIMAIENCTVKKGEDVLEIFSESFVSISKGCLNFLDFDWFLDGSSVELSTALPSFLSLDASGMGNDINEFIREKLAYTCGKVRAIESFYKPLKLGKEDLISTLRRL